MLRRYAPRLLPSGMQMEEWVLMLVSLGGITLYALGGWLLYLRMLLNMKPLPGKLVAGLSYGLWLGVAAVWVALSIQEPWRLAALLLMGFLGGLFYGLILMPIGGVFKALATRLLFVAITLPPIARRRTLRYLHTHGFSDVTPADLDFPLPAEHLHRLHAVFRKDPTDFSAAVALLALWDGNRTQLRRHFPRLQHNIKGLLPGPVFNVFCATCMQYCTTPKAPHLCHRCQQNEDLYADIQQLTLTYSEPEKPHLAFSKVADREQGTIRLNLVREQVFSFRAAPLTHVALDLRLVANPDLFLNRVLTSFEVLQQHPERINWQLLGTELLTENTRRLLLDMGIR